MSLRGRDHEDYPVTVNDHARLNPDDDYVTGLPVDDTLIPPWLMRGMRRLSIAALTPASTTVAGGNSSGVEATPVPNPDGRVALSPPRPPVGEPTSDVSEPRGSSARLA